MSRAIAAAVAIGLAVFGVVRGTWAVGGSDSSCYGLMAKAFSAAQLQPASTLAANAPWPDAAVTFAPGGFVASPVNPAAAAPICAPGMSVLMAPLAVLFGQDAIFWLTPIAAALLVWSAYVIAQQFAGGAAGVTAAILTATSPIVLYQAVQPMNDVVTAALWMLAIACAVRLKRDPHRNLSDGHKDPVGEPVLADGGKNPKEGQALAGSFSGVFMGLAILVRPNLAPLAAVVVALPLIAHAEWAARRRASLSMLLGAMPGIALMLWLNNALYGGALHTGYGSASALFSFGHISQNASNYGRALFDTQHVVPILALLAPLVFDGFRRRLAFALLAFAAIVAAIYLLYTPFPEWWYLRFLIPAIVALVIVSSSVVVQLISRLGMRGLVPIVAVGLAVVGTRAAGQRQAFQLQALEGRYRHTAQVVRDRLPANAVIITEWESGSIRFHAGRDVLLWQSLDPAWLDRAVSWLRAQGLQPYLLFERGEERPFRDRFRGQSEIGGLDWPPRVDINRQARIYDPADRARFAAGESYATENVR